MAYFFAGAVAATGFGLNLGGRTIFFVSRRYPKRELLDLGGDTDLGPPPRPDEGGATLTALGLGAWLGGIPTPPRRSTLLAPRVRVETGPRPAPPTCPMPPGRTRREPSFFTLPDLGAPPPPAGRGATRSLVERECLSGFRGGPPTGGFLAAGRLEVGREPPPRFDPGGRDRPALSGASERFR